MIRRLLLLGLLGLTACPSTPEPSASVGMITGALTPFRSQSTSGGTRVRPALLRDASTRRRLSQSISQALAARQQGTRREELTAGTEAADAIPGEVIVRFEQAPGSEEALLAQVQLPGYRAVHKASITDTLHVIGYESLEKRALKVGETVELLRRVGALGGVRYTEQNIRFHAFKTPNDPGYSRQWHYPMMNLPAAWDITTGSNSVAIGIVDTGIVSHPDLNGRVVQGADMISDAASAGDGNGRDNDPKDLGGDEPNGGSSWHGSHVAGTIGAVSNEGQGVAGVTWSGRIVPVRALGRGGGSFEDIAAGIQWASGVPVAGVNNNANPVQVINMSLGGESPPSAALQEIIDAAVKKGVIIVVAAGNSNIDASRFSPCNQQNVICVGAVRFNGKRASYSNFGTAVDVMATGGETAEDLDGDGKPDGVLSTILDDKSQPVWAYYQGTSMASPHVAGIVALMKSVNPGLTAAQAKSILKATADTTRKCAEGCGSGLINAQAAVREAQKLGGGGTDVPAKLGVGSTQLSFSGGGTQQITVRNEGGGSINVTATATGTAANALSFPEGKTLTLGAYGSGSLTVSVSTAGLANGSYVAQITLSDGKGQSVDVLVKITVGAATQDKDAIIAFAWQDKFGEWQVDQEDVAVVKASANYAYSMRLTPRTYYALATIDEDGDNELFEDGERVGFWRDATNIEPIVLTESKTVSNISFALVPSESNEGQPSTSRIGQPCTSDAQCGAGGLCGTGFPGGYCSQDCLRSSCPSGSKCYANTAGDEAYCYLSCSDVGRQGLCRTGYVCTDDGAGGGACVPP